LKGERKLENSQIESKPQDSAKMKKRRRMRLFLLIDLGVSLTLTTILVLLLLHRPASYNPAKPAETKEVNQYWTHVVWPQIYNGAQQQKPFEVEITEEGINQAITASGWPKVSEGAVFTAPQVIFTTDGVSLMGTATIENVDFVVTIRGKPAIEPNGLLSLNLSAFKVGALNVTPLAKVIARKMYAQRLSKVEANPDDINIKILNSLLDGKPFEPVFTIEDKKIKIVGVEAGEGKIAIKFAAAGFQRGKK
jgi:uncharacterized protein YpmS